ncbi:hypothetical protein A0123_02583 [Gluconobacter cerinus]|uniref:Uncharacterized protein n=1 Tax=Gluconobacter cerinus TaxID=38307 RepID=A0A1B6VIR4_9PROT|nr:hypothetical protein A0123_02583 [Gluconobacter cerinus]
MSHSATNPTLCAPSKTAVTLPWVATQKCGIFLGTKKTAYITEDIPPHARSFRPDTTYEYSRF